MKKELLISLAIASSISLFAQTPVNKTVVEIPKEFKKAKIALTELSNDNQLNVVLSQEKKERSGVVSIYI